MGSKKLRCVKYEGVSASTPEEGKKSSVEDTAFTLWLSEEVPGGIVRAVIEAKSSRKIRQEEMLLDFKAIPR